MADESVDIDLGEPGVVARVRTLDDEARHLTLEYRNGNVVSATAESPTELEVGDVILVHDDQRLSKAPVELWPDEVWIAVVRVKRPDITILDRNLHWVRVPTRDDVAYDVGNTVEATDVAGVVRVLSGQPISSIDLPELDDSVADRFKRLPDPSLSFDQFGGSPDVVSRARDLVETLGNYEKLAAIGSRSIKGALFTGPPGTGKTMLARAVAAQSGASFFQISGPEILSKWVGQTEELLRLLFEAAGREDRSIVFFDEIDSVAVQRDDAQGASRQVVAQLLTLMDGPLARPNVLVVAATNRPQDLDPALLRPGRFDWKIEFPLPSLVDRLAILEVSAKAHVGGTGLPHALVAANTEGWTGAELTGIWSEAALLAVADGRSLILLEDYLGGFEAVAANRNVQARVLKSLSVSDTGAG